MVLAHDTEAALLAAVTLVNSGEAPDTLTTTEQLEGWFLEHRYTGGQELDGTTLTELRALRARLRELLTADREQAAALVNAMLADARAVPQLVRHGNVDWHLHAVPAGSPLALQVVVETAMAMADLVRLDELSRIAICADSTCLAIVLDLTRNRSRRFCSTTCANRNAVAAYRARKR